MKISENAKKALKHVEEYYTKFLNDVMDYQKENNLNERLEDPNGPEYAKHHEYLGSLMILNIEEEAVSRSIELFGGIYFSSYLNHKKETIKSILKKIKKKRNAKKIRSLSKYLQKNFRITLDIEKDTEITDEVIENVVTVTNQFIDRLDSDISKYEKIKQSLGFDLTGPEQRLIIDYHCKSIDACNKYLGHLQSEFSLVNRTAQF